MNRNKVSSIHTILKSNKKFYKYNRKTKSYVKETPIRIKEIKLILISKKNEKIVSRRVKKELKVSKKQKPTKKHLEPLPEYKEENDTGYDITLFEFKCNVSDIRLTHNYGIRSEYADDVLDLHNGNFPDHEVHSFQYISDHHVNYESRQNYNGITSNQKEFLHRLGVNVQIIGSIKTKSEATQMITRLQRQ
jgi:hypothetical protein